MQPEPGSADVPEKGTMPNRGAEGHGEKNQNESADSTGITRTRKLVAISCSIELR